MSETMPIPPLTDAPPKQTPTVYFIDDSATMREVIKIAFRRENFNVITCADAASALSQFEQNPPDAVITDVIMPDTDGYSVCSQIREHAQFSATPVILMSGVVNKSVADKAVAVRADELIRKPFQPQELISRVKTLLEPKRAPEESAAPRHDAPSALSGLFAPPPAPVPSHSAPPAAPSHLPHTGADPAWPRALADAFTPRPPAPAVPAPFAPAPQRPAPTGIDMQKLRAEISRLELLVKKLQTELQIERQYNQALEVHVRTLTGLDQA
ncbi:MAG TPA: response regulator [Candidatus Acidoferrum sp.]|nr:response regulator [Candidatus Acidoferrum sp.]